MCFFSPIETSCAGREMRGIDLGTEKPPVGLPFLVERWVPPLGRLRDVKGVPFGAKRPSFKCELVGFRGCVFLFWEHVCFRMIALVFQNPPNTLWGSVFGPPKGRTSGGVKVGPNTDPHKVFGRLGLDKNYSWKMDVQRRGWSWIHLSNTFSVWLHCMRHNTGLLYSWKKHRLWVSVSMLQSTCFFLVYLAKSS